MSLSPSTATNRCLIKSANTRIQISGSHILGCWPKVDSISEDSNGLEVNAVFMRAGSEKVLFLSFDAMYIGPEIRRHAEELFRDDLQPQQIFMSASHTHNAPGLDPTKPDLANYSPEFTNATKMAISRIHRLLAEKNWSTGRLEVDTYFPQGIIQRRKAPPAWLVKLGFIGRDYLQLPNEKSTPRVSSTTFSFWNSETLLACIWVFPCHPVAYPLKSEISADFVGDLRRALRVKYDLNEAETNLSFVFMQGASGDLRPSSTSRQHVNGLRNQLFRFMVGKPFGRFEEKHYQSWNSLRAKELIDSISQAARGVDSKNEIGIRLGRSEHPLSEFFDYPGETDRTISVHSVELGKVKIVGVSSEISWGFFEEVVSNQAVQSPHVLVGCIDDTFGYTPSESQISEGGYEVDGWMASFGLYPKGPTRDRVLALKAMVQLLIEERK